MGTGIELPVDRNFVLKKDLQCLVLDGDHAAGFAPDQSWVQLSPRPRCWWQAKAGWTWSCGPKPRAEVVGEPQGQGHNRQGRVAGTAGREDRAPADEEIVDMVYPAIGVHDALRRIIGHPGGSHVMTAALEVGRSA
jgi:hypothetical protein